MPWSNNSGGPWGGGGRGGSGGGGGNSNSPWGRPSGGGGGGGGPFGNRPPPDVEELLRRSQDKVRSMLPRGMGWKGGVLGGAAAVLVWLAFGFYQVAPDEQGVELVFGKLTQVTQPGLNYNWPPPIGEAMTPKVAANNQVQIGFRDSGARAANLRDVTEESLMLTGDENIIDVQFAIRWKIKEAVDPANPRNSGAAKFLLNVRNPEETVKVAAEAAMREIVGQSNFEELRTGGRNLLAVSARDLIQSLLDSYDSGIEILEVNPQKVDPPGPVFDAFRDVQAAQADRERLINEATAFLNEQTERAQGAAERILRDAEAYKEERIAQATGDASRFLAVYEEFKTAPDVTKRRIYLQTMEDIMQNMKKVLIEPGSEGGGSGVVPYLPLNELTSGGTRPRSGN